MKRGYLSEYFSGVAAKLLSAVEARPESSHQHEFNGSSELVQILGQAGRDKHRLAARFLYFQEDSDEPAITDSNVTWYDARAKSAERTGRSEHRLYFSSNEVMRRAQESDLLLIAKRRDGSLLLTIAEGSSTAAAQLHWLFGLPDIPRTRFVARSELESRRDALGFIATLILEQIGVEADLSDSNYLQGMLDEFGGNFPSTKTFSAYARNTLSELNPKDDPDATLIAWMEREEVLFRTLEKFLIGERLRVGFLEVREPDVDGFLSYSLSVQNRRKARAGAALENHLESIFTSYEVRYERGAITEHNNRPDFIFPDGKSYRDLLFPAARLTMLAAKTTAKDRWRQVTREADRITPKHLLTLEPAISERQTDQMRESGVQLVVPTAIHGEYTPKQCRWLLTLNGFLGLVRAKR